MAISSYHAYMYMLLYCCWTKHKTLLGSYKPWWNKPWLINIRVHVKYCFNHPLYIMGNSAHNNGIHCMFKFICLTKNNAFRVHVWHILMLQVCSTFIQGCCLQFNEQCKLKHHTNSHLLYMCPSVMNNLTYSICYVYRVVKQ